MKEYILDCRLTSKAAGNIVTAIEFKMRGENLAELKHLAVDKRAIRLVEANELFGKLRLRVFVSEKEMFGNPNRLETMYFSCERPYKTFKPSLAFRSEV